MLGGMGLAKRRIERGVWGGTLRDPRGAGAPQREGSPGLRGMVLCGGGYPPLSATPTSPPQGGRLPAGGSDGLTAIAGMAGPVGSSKMGGSPMFWGRCGWWAGRCRGSISPLEGEMPGRAEGGMAHATRLGVWPVATRPWGKAGCHEAWWARHFCLTGEFVAGCRGGPLPAGGHPPLSATPTSPPQGGRLSASGSGGLTEIAAGSRGRPHPGWRVGGLVVFRPTERISARRPRPGIGRPKGGRRRRKPALRESRRD